ncbi:MAG: DUF4249 domain-containing protein [Crocinitomicaceae bacterium]|jgi:hypothetical protein|nr:DUF4249 domain-containing protein [Crocinitomicaceae bacterium]
MKYRFNNCLSITTLFCFTLLFSCEKEIPLDAEQKEPRIVVNSIFGDGDTIYVHVSESRDVLFEGDLPNLTTAVVKLQDINGNQLGDFTHLGDGIYKLTNYLPVVGQTYQLVVTNTGFDQVNAQTQTPSVITISTIDTLRKNDEMDYAIKFSDDPSITNYYAIAIEKISIFDDGFGGYEIYSDYYFETAEIFTQNGSTDVDGTKYGSIFLFSDATFSGGQCVFDASNYIPVESSDSLIVVVSLMSLSEDYFKYKLSLEKYQETAGDPFAQPVQVYSNVENGFGIFGGYSVYRDSIFFE